MAFPGLSTINSASIRKVREFITAKVFNSVEKIEDVVSPRSKTRYAALMQKAFDELDERRLVRLVPSTVGQAIDKLKEKDPTGDGRHAARLLPLIARTGLARLDQGQAYLACSRLLDMTAMHERLVDPASIALTKGSDRPVIVGPWLMEVGFELLYWIPFVRATLARHGIAKDRVIAISRGGAASWYSDIAGRYFDILDVFSPQEFHDWTNLGLETGRKITRKTSFETGVLDRVLASKDLADYDVLLPSAMYGLFRNAWRARIGALPFAEHLTFAKLTSPPFDRTRLPFAGDYVAVKLYGSDWFALTPETQRFCDDLIRQLSQRTNVVLLSNSAILDDHETVAYNKHADGHTIFDASSLYEPKNNLDVQSGIIAQAKALHCTYGGFSYLGPLLNVETFSYTRSYDFLGTHLDLAHHMIEELDTARLSLLPTRRSVIELIGGE